jgi:hypothetical protein
VDGSIVATRVDAALGSRESFVRGVPRESEAAVRVGGVAIERMQGSASLATRYGEGRIRVSGSWDAERETLDVTRVDESPTVSRGPREVDIEGYVRSVHGHELRIGEVTIVASSTGMANAINSLEVDDRIRIRATRKGEGAGTFDVKSIERVSVNALLQILKKAGGAGGGARADGPVGSKKDKPEHPAHPSHPGQSARPVSAGNSSNASQARSSRPTRPAVAQSAMRPARPARVERPSRPQRPERPNAARPTVDRPRGAGRGGRN